MNSQSREAKRFLRKMDKDLTKICQSSRTNRNSLNEVVSVLTDRTIMPLRRQKSSYFNGADCGIRWWSIALCVIISVIVIPLILLLYFWYTGHLTSHTTSNSGG
ncbi:hypothetical protein FSP39_013083 [Pinctada imbricata]|uniref:Uncharacterized protein n=1 Tax=Pinctada imbricata TaxID=66713 RepID=A0AA88Y4K9_PINIB|nr:hypothetical protein FSP39_013083 [Pinctada imbricata]